MAGTSNSVIVRRAKHSDVKSLQLLIDKSFLNAFGRVNWPNVLERAILSLTVLSCDGEIVGCSSFFDSLTAELKSSEDWHSFVSSNSVLQRANSSNALFIRPIILWPSLAEKSLLPLFKRVFTCMNCVHMLCLVTNRNAAYKIACIHPFQELPPLVGNELHVSIVHRHAIFPALSSRLVTVEDNDDLVPLFNDQTDILRKTYGKYYISELAEAQNDYFKCAVIEHDRKAVGLIGATTEVDVDEMDEQYDLKPFNGLRNQAAADECDTVPHELSSDLEISHPDHSGQSPGTVQENIATEHSDHNSTSSVNGPSVLSNWIRRPLLERCERSGQSLRTLFHGESDAFAVQLCAIKSGFESRFIDMLPLLFDQFPDANYAVIAVPRLTPVFPMLRHFVGCRVLKGMDPKDELYVLHRNGLLSEFGVRRTKREDKEQVKELISKMHLDDQALLMGDLEAYINQGRDEDGAVVTSFVAEAMNRIVGIVILRDERHIEWLRANYELEDFIYFGHHSRTEHATLFHCVLAVNFHCRYAYFLQEVMRQGGKTCLYYHIMPPYSTTELYCRSTLVTCLPYLYPVRPRRQIIYPPKEILGEKAPAERLLVGVTDPPALFLGTAQLLVEPREEINARIIVVGASTTGLAVLTTLVMCSHIRFRNLVLLSPNGLPGDTLEKPSELAMNFLSTDHCFSLEKLGQYALRHCVHVVHGKLTAIDRKFKFITINHEKRLDYDYLVLTPGLQYHIWYPEKENTVETEDNEKLCKSSTRPAALPMNVFLTTDFVDAERILHWISEEYIPVLGSKDLHLPAWKKATMQWGHQAACTATAPTSNEPVGGKNGENIIGDGIMEENRLIVYGYRLDAYTCIATLLRAGIPGRYIVMIQPPKSSQDKATFDNPIVENAVHSQMAEMDVQICEGYTLHGWRVKASEKLQIEEATFVSSQHTLRILCKALFCYDERRVDYDLFSAANDACLVFDARLVIDANFRTNDPAICAAGPVTKLQRIYYNDFWRHELGSSLEIGTSLGQQMLTLFTCDKEFPQKPDKDSRHLLPEFHEPKVMGGILPGDYHYLHISKPELPGSSKHTKSQSHKERLLTTGTPNEGYGFFCLHINQYNAVQALTCLSKTPFPASNYIQLFGAHEKLLNNFLTRYDEGLVPDLYSFFNDVWPLAIYHNRFADFQTQLRELLHSHSLNGINPLTEKIHQLIAEGGEIKQEDLERLKTLYKENGYSEMVEEELFSFINFNYDLLPMYAKPDLV